MNDLFWLTIFLFIVAAALRSELFFYLLYVVVGLQVLARVWLRQGTRSLSWHRRAPVAAFPGEPLTVELEVKNSSVLPIPWVALQESIPPTLHNPPIIREVVSLRGGERHVFTYTLIGRQRGYYRLGPLSLRTGDVLGLGEHSVAGDANNGLTIYPTILPLAELGLPASLPYGTLATKQRLFSDPARPAGVRPYHPSDGVRGIDWKTTAHAGFPQVRRYQPAIALETLIGLAFSRGEYGGRYIYDYMERALVVAASIAVYLAARSQPIGFVTTGRDPATNIAAPVIRIAAGHPHLIHILGTLGRLEPTTHGDLAALLLQASAHLSWGSTIVMITGQRGVELLTALLPLKQRGFNVALIMIEPTPDELALPRRHGITAFGIWRDGRPSPN